MMIQTGANIMTVTGVNNYSNANNAYVAYPVQKHNSQENKNQVDQKDYIKELQEKIRK